ncbi:MAG TPA: site-2 protease family protein [Terriglobales bacterium]|jgi:Zn-dependent protease/CBS domain-containing protein
MRSWSIHGGRIFGIDLQIHVSFLFLLAFVWMTDSAEMGADAIGRGVALTFLVLASVLLHEVGHRLAGMHQNRSARPVLLLPIGGVPIQEEPDREPVNPRDEFRVALAGPLVNILLAFVGAAILLGIAPESSLSQRPLVFAGNLPRSFVWVNVFLAAINFLPAYPLDGGRVVRAILARRMDPVRATRRAVSVGQGFALAFILLGIWNTWLMMIGFFLFLAAQLEDRHALFHAVLAQVRLEDVMLTDFSTLSPADTLEDALHKAVHTLQDDFPVVRGSDMVGVVSRQRIVDALRASGNGYVQSVMNRVFSAAQSSDTLASAFRKLTSHGITLLPVVHGGRLVGIITLQNLMHSMSLLAEAKRLHGENAGSSE